MSVKTFIYTETGASTLDFTVMGAALIGLGLAVTSVVSTGLSATSQSLFMTLTLAGNNYAFYTDFDDTRGLNVDGSGTLFHTDIGGSYQGWHATRRPFDGAAEEPGRIYIHDPDVLTLSSADATMVASRTELTTQSAPSSQETPNQLILTHNDGLGSIQRVLDAPSGSPQTYKISFDHLRKQNGNEHSNVMDIYYGGEWVGTVDQSNPNTWNNYEFNFTSDLGDGSNVLELRDSGHNTHRGSHLQNLMVTVVD